MSFCEEKGYKREQTNENTQVEELANIRKDCTFTTKKKVGENYKQSVVLATLRNVL